MNQEPFAFDPGEFDQSAIPAFWAVHFVPVGHSCRPSACQSGTGALILLTSTLQRRLGLPAHILRQEWLGKVARGRSGLLNQAQTVNERWGATIQPDTQPRKRNLRKAVDLPTTDRAVEFA